MIIKDVPSLKIYLFRLIVIAFAGFVYALGISLFIIPNQFLSGGIGGISLIIYELTGFSPSISIILLNLPVFIVGYKTIDKHFIFSSLVGMLAFSVSMTLTRGLIGALYVPSEILATIYGGVFTGIGMGLAFKSRGSFGGTDVLSAILKRKKNMNMGSTLFFFNLIIVGLASIIFEPYKGMYSLVGMFIGSAVVDKLIAGFEKRISVLIVSSEHGAIISYLHSQNRGATILHGQGSYYKEDIPVIYTVLPAQRLAKLKDFIQSVDMNAFVSVSNTTEIMGHWNQRHGKKTYQKND